MAKATVNMVQPVPPPPTVENITLELSLEEAALLYYVTGKIGGPITGPRGVLSDQPGGGSINSVLRKALLDTGEFMPSDYFNGYGTIYQQIRSRYNIKKDSGMTLEANHG